MSEVSVSRYVQEPAVAVTRAQPICSGADTPTVRRAVMTGLIAPGAIDDIVTLFANAPPSLNWSVFSTSPVPPVGAVTTTLFAVWE